MDAASIQAVHRSRHLSLNVVLTQASGCVLFFAFIGMVVAIYIHSTRRKKLLEENATKEVEETMELDVDDDMEDDYNKSQNLTDMPILQPLVSKSEEDFV